jgi:outer membrane receptor protein involved in Fe transport
LVDGYVPGENETEYQGYSTQGAVDLPVNEKLQIRIAGLYEDQDGWVRNVTEDRSEPSEMRKMLRGVAKLEVTPQLSAVLKLQTSNYRSQGNPFEFATTTNPTALRAFGVTDVATIPYVKYESAAPDGDTDERQIHDDHALTLTYDLASGHTVTAVTGYSRLKMQYGFDSDSTPLPYLFSQFNEKYEQLSQEIRLTSPKGETFDYIVGAFILSSKERYDYISSYRGFPVAGGLYGQVSQQVDQDEDAYAIFGQGSWHISPVLNLDFGGRYSSDKKDGVFRKQLLSDYGRPNNALVTFVPGSSIADKIDDQTFDFSATLSYKLTDRSSLYVSAGRGNKGGAFLNQSATAARAPNPFAVPKEVATTYEIGVKGRFLEGRAYVSLAAYHLDITDYQDSFYNSAARAFQVRSLDAKSSGVEIEGQFQAADWLNLYGNASWNPEAELANGERMQRSPKFTGTIGARVKKELSADFDLSGNIELMHSDNFLHQPASAPGDNGSHPYDLVNLRAQVTYKPMELDVYVQASNLTEEEYRTFSFGSPLGIGQIVAYNAPRMVKIGLRKAF